MSAQFLTPLTALNDNGDTATVTAAVIPPGAVCILNIGFFGGNGAYPVETVADTSTLTWVRYTGILRVASTIGGATEIWYAYNTTGSTVTTDITVTFGINGILTVLCQVATDVNQTNPFDPGTADYPLPALVNNVGNGPGGMVATVGTLNSGTILTAFTSGEQLAPNAPPPLTQFVIQGANSFRNVMSEADGMALSGPLSQITLTSPWTFGGGEVGASMIVYALLGADNSPAMGVPQTGTTIPGSPTIISPNAVTLYGQGVLILAAGGRSDHPGPAIVSITDTAGLTWKQYAQQIATSAATPSYADAEIWYAIYGGVNPLTTYLTVTTTGDQVNVTVVPFTSVDIASVFDSGFTVPLPNLAFTDTGNSYAALDTSITTSRENTFIAVVGAGNIATSPPALPSGIAEIALLQQGGNSGIPLMGSVLVGQQSPSQITSVQAVNFPSDWNASGGAGAAIAFALSGYVSPIVPSVIDITIPAAEIVLEDAGYVLGTITYAYSAIINAGNIISQSPAAGAAAAFGTPVSVVVSKGLPPLRVPLILFDDEPTAITAITNVGLVVGSINFVSSSIFAAGEVMGQNPAAGTIVASGSLVSFTVSLGESITSVVFDYEPTVISQFANSPSMLQWLANCNQYFDQSANVAAFISVVWNIDTAIGFGLDILGAIVGVSRLLRIPNAATYFGFANAHSVDWDNFGSKNSGGAGMAPFYTGFNSTEAYLLNDDPYRQLILAKAFANICTTTCPAMNQILQNLYGVGAAYVLNTGPMAISYNFTFIPSAIQLAILEQSGVIPTPPGVADTIVTP